MKKFSKIVVLLLALVFMFSFSTYTVADVGNFESYDSDWGYSWDYDYGGSYDYDYGSSSGGFFFIPTSLSGLIIWIILIIIIVNVRRNNAAKPSPYPPPRYSDAPYANSTSVFYKIQAVDEFFNEDKFLAWAKNLFVKLQNAWTERNWEEIRTFETEELFEQHSIQLKQYIDKKQINVMDRIAVNYAKLYSFSQDNDKDTLKILLNSSMIDYIKDEVTGNILMGDTQTRRTKTYLMTFIRKKGLKTQESTSDVKTSNCPNCGAPTKVTSSGKCEYCGSIITKGNHDWVLSNIEPYNQ